MEFTAAADELYGVPPAEFVATRRRLAGELPREEARQLAALRRPTVPAWAVNLLVRDDAVDPLLELGERMRDAWSSGGDIGDLERERTAMIDRLVRRARALAGEAGRPLSDAFASEVEDTLRAAVADPSAADAVRGGRLEHPLRHAGFGPFGGVSAEPRRPGGKKQDAGRPTSRAKEHTASAAKTGRSLDARRAEKARREEQARREAEARRREEARAAARRAEEADRSLSEWTAELESARQLLAEADERLDERRSQVKAAENDRATLDRRAQVAQREHERAARAAKEARRRSAELALDEPKGRHA